MEVLLATALKLSCIELGKPLMTTDNYLIHVVLLIRDDQLYEWN